MSTLKKTMATIFKNRIFAMVALSLVCLVTVLSISLNTKKVTVIDGDKEVTILTMNSETDAVLQQAGITLNQDDIVKKIEEGNSQSTYQVQRAMVVTVVADGMSQDVILHSGTVKDAMEIANVVLSDDDNINVKMTSVVEDGMNISVDRVEYRDITTTQEIPYEKVTQEVDTMYKGTSKVYSYGIKGERTIVTREKIVNGVVLETTEISNEVTKEKTDFVTYVGTKEKPKAVVVSKATATNTITQLAETTAISDKVAVSNTKGIVTDSNGNTASYSKVFSGYGTAYTAKEGAGTSIGMKAQYGVVAVNPKLIPYGTRLYICSPDGKFVYGYAVAGDTGGTVMRNNAVVDCYYDSYAGCATFGWRQICLYVLD